MDRADFQHALIAIQAEYVDMPALTLTMSQLVRLGTAPSDVCKAAVGTLVATGFLIENADGSYARRGTPPVRVQHLDVRTWAVSAADGLSRKAKGIEDGTYGFERD